MRVLLIFGMFASWWKPCFGDVLPLGYKLREALPNRWFRIHSLPGSKRYAEKQSERRILLDRQRRLASRVLPDQSRCFVVVPRYQKLSRGAPGRVPEMEDAQFSCESRGKLHADSKGDDVWFLVSTQQWDFAVAERALLAIAEDRLRAVWVNCQTSEIFAPYDGGVDVILASSRRRDAVKSEFAKWLSPRSDGL